LPVFPWDTLADVTALARSHPDGIVDLSVGTPVDPVAPLIREALAAASSAPGYPTTAGTPALRASAEQGSLAAMERLLDAFRRLDQATTLTALIDALAEAAAGETTRSAVFVVRGREVRGWRVAGFSDAPADVRLVSVPLDGAGAIGVCVRSKARVEITPATFAGSGDLGFIAGVDAAAGLAMPVTLGGETAAVIYGDDAGTGGPAGWRETIEILARHASRCLEAQTAIRAAKLAPGSQKEPVGA